MNKYQEEEYKNDANEIESGMRGEGYLSSDIVAVAYLLLKANIDNTEELQVKDKRIADLISRADNLLKYI